MNANPFGEFEADFKKTEAADPAAMPGRVPEETYKFVCTAIDAKDDGVLIDHEIFVTPKGTKAFKLYCEVLEPAAVMNPKTKKLETTKGQIVEKVFWITGKTLPYVKRDLATVMGREFRSDETLGDVCMNTAWAGRTFEGVVRDGQPNGGYTRSEINFINPWAPPAPAGANAHGVATGSTPPADPEDKDKTRKAEKPPADPGTKQPKSATPAGAPDSGTAPGKLREAGLADF